MNKSDYLAKQELDQLKLKWVLGKNRGQDAPLAIDDLLQLVGSGRIELDKLSKTEMNMIDVFSPENSIDADDENVDMDLLTRVYGLVSQLMSSEANASEEDKENLFLQQYGVSSEEMGYRLYTKLRSIW